MKPSDFWLFLFQLGITENKYNYKYKYGRNSQLSNAEHEMRIRIASTGSHGFPGTVETVLSEYMEKTKELLTYHNHTFQIIEAPK